MKTFFAILVLSVIAAVAIWQWPSVPEFSESLDRIDVHDDARVPGQRSGVVEEHSARESKRGQAEALSRAPSDSAVAWNPFDSTSDAKNMIMDSAKAFGWDEASALQTARNWARACEPTRRLESFQGASLDQSSERGLFPLQLVYFAEFCRTLPGAEEFARGEARDQILHATAGSLSSNLRRAEIRELLDRDPDLARESLIAQLHRALLSFDEATVSASVLSLLMPEMVAIRTQIEGRFDLWFMEYASVLDAVTMSLLCQYQGGCSGGSHPFVLRVCMAAFENSGVGCLDPMDLSEAIYQTQTPVENLMYRNVFDQINQLLVSYRRNS